MSAELTIYEKPTCTTCRKTVKLLKEQGVEFEDVNYFIDPLSAAKIAELLDKMGIAPRDLLRKKEQKYRDLGLKDSNHGDLELIELMADAPGADRTADRGEGRQSRALPTVRPDSRNT